MIQIRYRIPKGFRPCKSQLDEWRRQWIESKAVEFGDYIEAIDWRAPWRSQESIRAELRKKKNLNTVAGIVARYSEPHLTLCDYDRPLRGVERRVYRVARLLGLGVRWIEYRRTRRGWHMAVCWSEELVPIEQVVIQAILGSDPVRETFNLARLRAFAASGDQSGVVPPRWNLLFKEKLK